MDAHSRGESGGIDPADQWVLNPQTGNYELRLNHSEGQPSAPSRDAGNGSGAPRRSRNTPPTDDGSPRGRSARDRRAPGAAGAGAGAGAAAGADGASDGAGARIPRARNSSGSTGASGTSRRDVPGQRGRRAANNADSGAAAAGRRKRKAPSKSRKKKILGWTGGITAFVLIGGAGAAYYAYQELNGNIKTIDVQGAGGGFKKDQAVNILVIGTDKRTGAGNESYGDKNSVGHADTTILFHVSKDRTNATALSIPRDLITDIPDCETKTEEGTKVIPGEQGVRFNTSLGQAERDPGCTMRTVEELTGLPVHHFMMADFNAVKTLTSAVGGVEVCVAKDVDDPDSHLKLTKGKHVIKGEQALAFVRTRHSFGNESDLDRIQTQQQFLGSLIRKMKSSETLTNPAKLWDLATAATDALTVDTGIGSIEKLRDVGMELAKVNPKNISFTTLPVIDNPAEVVKATVVVNEAQAKPLFAMMQSDTSLTEVKQKEKAAKSKQAALLKGTKADPADVRVDVFNGGGPQGSAQETLAWLQNEEGVNKSTNKGNAPEDLAKTSLEYAPNQADQARRLADMMGLPAEAMKPGKEDAVGLEAMTLTLGADFKGAGIPIVGPAKAPEGVQKVEADKQVCAK
ncbi:LytR family transcriptional regulator [Streptomyces camponoticapitis]|uniref:LytR family transcriptional regulator n=1 Tax=Streptomyces camponoticapitis TaxID=1616125 RepID=A0ABQ2EEM4_9ACTN|nr:LCP family protein [Streptomyces camponoticapitis]GGK09306.1 LytR family transcriptional regulator [Streptomyces camponoticapitis]